MPNIIDIHNRLFDYLIGWNSENRFSKAEINPFFNIRSVNDSMFQDGYWFPGNEKSLCLSFWAGGDSLNKTPNIYFEVAASGATRGIIVARDSEDKFAYFTALLNYLDAYKISYTSQNQKRKGIWVREYHQSFNYIDALKRYIEHDKFYIDRFVIENDPRNSINDYSSSFGFISDKEYETNYSRVRKRKLEIEDDIIRLEAAQIATGKIDPKPAISGNIDIVPENLPCAIQLIDIKNYQGIKNVSLEILPQNNQWIFITGENGYGKSSVLQAIALGLRDDRILDGYLADDTRIEICVANETKKDTFIRLKYSTSSAEPAFYSLIIAYGPVRLNTVVPESRNIENATNNNVISLFQSTTLLKNLQWELFAKKHTNEFVFNQLENAIRDVTNGRIDSIEFDGEKVLFKERLSNGEVLPAIPLEKLAAGFRSIINIVGDIIIRFSDQFKYPNYNEFYGLVLIDEIENHLHPLLQRELPEALSRVFPKIQFIATTHSPIPLLGAPKGSVILTVSRTLDDGITLERLDDQMDFGNLLPNSILSSPIFGFENIIPASNTDISEIYTTPDFASVKKLNEVKSNLNLKKIDFDAIDLDLKQQHKIRNDDYLRNKSREEGLPET